MFFEQFLLTTKPGLTNFELYLLQTSFDLKTKT